MRLLFWVRSVSYQRSATGQKLVACWNTIISTRTENFNSHYVPAGFGDVNISKSINILYKETIP